jgi:hypothetical protein
VATLLGVTGRLDDLRWSVARDLLLDELDEVSPPIHLAQPGLVA